MVDRAAHFRVDRRVLRCNNALLALGCGASRPTHSGSGAHPPAPPVTPAVHTLLALWLYVVSCVCQLVGSLTAMLTPVNVEYQHNS